VSARLRRVERLVVVGQDAVTAARTSAAAAARATAQAREAVAAGERAWSDAALRFGSNVTRAGDLDEQSAHLRALRMRADESGKLLDQAIADERRRSEAVVQAATDLRKLEMLRDRIMQAQREEDNRAERRSSDELAARGVAARRGAADK
jgi:Flagellar FliJ protein